MFVPLLLLALAAPATPAQSSNSYPVLIFGGDADELVEKCRHVTEASAPSGVDPSTVLGAQSCLSFIAGVVDGGQLAARGDHRLFPICFPSGVTTTQLAKIVVKYGDDHPEKLNIAGAAFVVTALRQAFPCPAKR
jgi:hypothetical protein